MSDAPADRCHLLALPAELRLDIFTYVLASFSGPVKLRQFVEGSGDTAILRTSRQIYGEALGVFYDVNTIAVTRNDFCNKTDASLKTPVKTECIRYLSITNFSESLACNSSVLCSNRCDVCDYHASGLLLALSKMPCLKSAVIDYQTQGVRFQQFQRYFTDFDSRLTMKCTAVGVHKLRGQPFDGVEISFQHTPLATVWPALIALSRPMPSDLTEDAVLHPLRGMYPEIVDRLWLTICAHRYGLRMTGSVLPQATWAVVEDECVVSPDVRSAAFDDATTRLRGILGVSTAVQCRQRVQEMRASLSRMEQ